MTDTEKVIDAIDAGLTLRRASESINRFPVQKITSIVMARGMMRELVDGEDIVGLLAPELDQYIQGAKH